jgi:hypothetical protein
MYTVGWLPCGNEQVGSSRISVFNVHKEFLKMNITSYILQTPSTVQHELKISTKRIQRMLRRHPLDILFLQKVFDKRVIELAQSQHIKVVLGVCDVVNEIAPLLDVADAIVVYSNYHKEHLPEHIQRKVHILPSGYETPTSLCRIHKDQAPLRAVSFGARISSFPSWLIEGVAHLDYRPVGIGFDNTIRHRIWKQKGEHHKWSLQNVYSILSNCDVGMIHANMNGEFWKYKSPNRLIQMMALGLPVIASPIPSYSQIIEQGKNGFLATSRQDWMHYLEILRDVETRIQIGAHARESVLSSFGIQQQANCYHDLFMRLLEHQSYRLNKCT